MTEKKRKIANWDKEISESSHKLLILSAYFAFINMNILEIQNNVNAVGKHV